MSGLDVVIVQDNISAYVRQQFPNYVVYDDVVLDDEFVIKQGNKVKPYIVLQYGGLRNSPTGGSFGGVRYDEYYSTVDVAIIAPTPKQTKVALNIVMDTLIGWKPAGSTPMKPEGGMDTLGISQTAGKPTVYLSSSRLRYNINGENVAEHIVP